MIVSQKRDIAGNLDHNLIMNDVDRKRITDAKRNDGAIRFFDIYERRLIFFAFVRKEKEIIKSLD